MWVPVEEAGRHELVQDTQGKRREDGVEDVVEGQRPRFVDDFAGEDVLEDVLATDVSHWKTPPEQ